MTSTSNAPQPHRPADQRRSATGRHARRLTVTLVLTSGFLVVEVAAAFWTGSLALLADAGHMLTDVGGLALALFAGWMASKPPTPAKSYGYYRVEILAALANGALLLGVAALILYEAYRRLREAQPAAGQFTVRLDGREQAIGEKAAAGLFVRPA